MSTNYLNSHWYRVGKLKPKIHGYITTHRHIYRKQIWYILENTATGLSYRFNPSAFQFIGLLDGSLSVEDIYSYLADRDTDHSPSQEEIIQLMSQLDNADLIQTEALINTETLFERQAKHKSLKFRQRFANPISQRIPLWDPDSFLNKHFNKVSWIFSIWAALVWMLVITYCLLQTAIHWSALSNHLTVNSLSSYNLLIIFIMYPIIKVLHELGHAFSAKLEKGEVHEMGINFLMFIPIPYVDVSTATHFRSKYKRMLVGAAGILMESFLAALGLLLFFATEPGIIQDIGFNAFLIGGVSSLFFNGNPLLKFDGYYILADALGIPNLYHRAFQYWRYLFQHYLFGLKHVTSPAMAPGESFWFIIYSVSSFLYKLGILWFICVYVTEKFFILGVILAIWLISIQLLFPLSKAIQFVLNSPALSSKRNRALLTSVSLISLTIGIIGFTPLPSYTSVEGVVWLPDEAQIKAQHNGFADDFLVSENQRIQTGTRVINLRDPFLESKVKVARAKVQEFQAKYRAARGKQDNVKAEIIKEQIQVAKSELIFFNDKLSSMSILAKKSGQIILPEASDLSGRFIHQGELLGYILDGSLPTIRMAIHQDNMGQFRQHIEDIDVRLATRVATEYPATIIRQAPEATNQLPSAALTRLGGGKFTNAPNSNNKSKILEKVFLVDLSFNPKDDNIPMGTRAYVRINHGSEALAAQWFRRIRQAFLRQLNV